MFEESWGWEQAEMVQSEKVKGFLTCSNCHKPYIERWSWGAKNWKYCPCCGRQFKNREVEHEQNS